MNLLVSKFDKVDNNSEVESLIFELHSLKAKKNKTGLSNFENRKISLPDTILSSPLKHPSVPKKLQKKIQKFIKKIESDKSETKTMHTEVQDKRYESSYFQDSVTKRKPTPGLSATVKYIHQDPEIYNRYQDLCLYYEETVKTINLRWIKVFLNIKSPSKLEKNIGTVLVYLAAHLDSSIMLSPVKTKNKVFSLRNNTWTFILSQLKKISSAKLYKYLTLARKELESYPICELTTKEMSKLLHSIPGMKFSMTSANSANSNKLYDHVYRVYELCQLFVEVHHKIDSTIIPKKLPGKHRATVQKELYMQSFVKHNKKQPGRIQSTLSRSQLIRQNFNSFTTSNLSNAHYQSIVKVDLSSDEKQSDKSYILDTSKYMSCLNNKSIKKMLSDSKIINPKQTMNRTSPYNLAIPKTYFGFDRKKSGKLLYKYL
jgi:hypothetical protein